MPVVITNIGKCLVPRPAQCRNPTARCGRHGEN
jgi:hypothetical protein